MTMSTSAGSDPLRVGDDLLRTGSSRYPDLEDLVDLAGYRGGPRVSVYLPLKATGSTYDKSRSRARNLLRQVGRAMRADGLPRSQVGQLLAEAEAVVSSLRQQPAGAVGLALFLGRERVKYFLTPTAVPEVAVVGDRFTVAPLLPAFTADGRFFVLAVDHEEISLFAGTEHSLSEVDLAGHELAAWKSLPPARAQRRRALLRYFGGVDRALRSLLEPEGAPLVVAAVGDVQALHAQANTYPHLLVTGVDGNPRDLTVDELHTRAWALVAPEVHRPAAEALTRYRSLHGTGRTLQGAAEVLPAAERGRIEALLVTRSIVPDARSAAAALRRFDHSADPDGRVERAALATVGSSGQVFLVDGADIGDAVAGILRTAGPPLRSARPQRPE